MATKFKFEIESDGLNTAQTLAFRTFIGTLGGTEATQHHLGTCLGEKITPDYAEGIKKDIVEAVENTKKKRASRAKVEEPQASAYSIQDVRDRVKKKQGKWRPSIKAELGRLGSSNVSLLDPAHFEEFCNFMDNLA